MGGTGLGPSDSSESRIQLPVGVRSAHRCAVGRRGAPRRRGPSTLVGATNAAQDTERGSAMGIQTIMLSAVWGPILGFFNFLKMALAMLFILPMAVLRIATKGPKSLARYDKLFEFLSGIFLGKFFFSQLVGALAPYSASIGARILKVLSGEAYFSFM
ncbi:hypothetical protein T484DRAFT_1807005 [Baffinella frigidus]|nr:hypothetical protein T484DRAFT_1807005 [Cryptophyta sp. CCMP2293]